MIEPLLHVAVGVIKSDNRQQVLISKRFENAHQGGLWEFPGGKIEKNESVLSALKRELFEELDIKLNSATPLIQIIHHYSDLSVLLDVWEINSFSGKVKGREGQKIQWVSEKELGNYNFPKANNAIIKAIRLPRHYAILDDSSIDKSLLIVTLNNILKKEIKLIHARLKKLSKHEAETFLKQALPLCKQHQALLLINSEAKCANTFKSKGIHLTSKDLMTLTQRPENQIVAASCHNLEQLHHAEKIDADFAVLAPVQITKTHPNDKALGWQNFHQLVKQCSIPVFALGGLNTSDLKIAINAGAQGIAGIRMFY